MLDITTPALLFPAISLLLLAYTNRFQVVALLIRQLNERHAKTGCDINLQQVELLRRRIEYIKYMQALGIMSFLFCTFAMFEVFVDQTSAAVYLFATSLLLLVASLIYALIETLCSTDALGIELKNLSK